MRDPKNAGIVWNFGRHDQVRKSFRFLGQVALCLALPPCSLVHIASAGLTFIACLVVLDVSQGWKERAIWGKVRYMNDAGLKRKFNMAAYIYKVERLVKKHGLPPIVQPVVRSKPKAPGRVTTLEEVNARAAAKRGKQAKTNGDNSNKRKRKA